jgi:hypothetical protein
MSTQPPEQNPNDYDEVTRLRLQLNHAEVQRDAFAAALKADVLKVVRVSIIQATIDADEEVARLKAEVEELGKKLAVADASTLLLKQDLRSAQSSVEGLMAQLVELDDLKAENARMTKDEAYYEMRHKELIADKLRLGHQVMELADKLRKEG